MAWMADSGLTDFLFSVPEPWVLLLLGILLVVCSTERGGATNVDHLLTRQASGNRNGPHSIARLRPFLLHTTRSSTWH